MSITEELGARYLTEAVWNGSIPVVTVTGQHSRSKKMIAALAVKPQKTSIVFYSYLSVWKYLWYFAVVSEAEWCIDGPQTDSRITGSNHITKKCKSIIATEFNKQTSSPDCIITIYWLPRKVTFVLF